MGAADLHIHSRHGDGMASVDEILERVEADGRLDVIAFTEHDTLRASEEARESHARGGFGFEIVPGMEVTTLDGHLLALWIDEPVRSFTRIEAALEAIHRQGGLAIAPHPLSRLTRSVRRPVFERVAAAGGNDGVYFDAMEEVNMSPAGRSAGSQARALNQTLGLAAIGASDAHFLEAVGCGHTEFEGASSAELREAVLAKTTTAHAGRHPSIRELGYRNVALQSWRGMMATPRAMGWGATLRSFVVSHRLGSPDGNVGIERDDVGCSMLDVGGEPPVQDEPKNSIAPQARSGEGR